MILWRGQSLRGAPCPRYPRCSGLMPVLRHRVTSRVLVGNPLGDPIERDLNIPYRYDVSLPFLGEAILKAA
jgi:hypothetical protein